MRWNNLESLDQLEEIKSISSKHPVLLFKHSTRCSISAMALNRLERKWSETKMHPYFLDLIAHRDISNSIATDFGIQHESPQALLIKNGTVVFHTSHMGIDFDELDSVTKNLETV